MPLTIQELQSSVWMKLKAHYLTRLQNLRELGDGEMEQDKRNKHLGRIAEVKALLAIEEAPVKEGAFITGL